ncbi:hypothetical protein F5Y19DRAFT_469754 [Xylariaceae sp. FL1651]|nr:hypothetical protein F5Y19DRAFT_469754 [Xylariaceae sp. FL1651]
MAALMRISRPIGSAAASVSRKQCCSSCRPLSTAATRLATRPNSTITTTTKPLLHPCASFHVTSRRSQSDEPPTTDFAAMDVLSNTPVPSTAVDICMSDGFQLNSGARILDGSGVILVGGEAFAWRPWLPRGEHRLLNAKGQWEIPNDSLGLMSLLWPRPGSVPLFPYTYFCHWARRRKVNILLMYGGTTDLLILGLGPEIRPISPELRRHISSLGMRVEILDTRNAAAQFNLLATERGVNDVAAALIPIGWKEGIGADW